MAWQEIIQFRSINIPDKEVRENIRERIRMERKRTEGLLNFHFLENINVETDLAIILTWRTNISQESASSLAQNLALILSQFGQVTQSMWQEI